MDEGLISKDGLPNLAMIKDRIVTAAEEADARKSGK